ncbi:hypothetical protein BU26DRAFT_176182 [Trematosphaeria pertusa]|uniref:Uncharacterized protein n=1 Tax=Trematosphaeria pertusa TaxID=390896 RepID=A0A6A6HUU5_9PLEO|nr:uncharacterized protein BU26DRAFT_176182 [Trematosphaeria pertusa]KAF2241323.1 hypothetical protein BU26DRAFT_176182 [Trematosphaeria pertusa]
MSRTAASQFGVKVRLAGLPSGDSPSCARELYVVGIDMVAVHGREPPSATSSISAPPSLSALQTSSHHVLDNRRFPQVALAILPHPKAYALPPLVSRYCVGVSNGKTGGTLKEPFQQAHALAFASRGRHCHRRCSRAARSERGESRGQGAGGGGGRWLGTSAVQVVASDGLRY